MISPLQRILGLVHPGVGHVEPDPLPEGAGDGVGGVDPAVSVEDVLGVGKNVFTAEAVRLPPAPASLFASLGRGIKAISSAAYQDGGNLTRAGPQ